MGDYSAPQSGRHSGHSTPYPGVSPLAGFRNLAIDDYTQSLQNHFDSSRPGFPAHKSMELAIELFFEHFGPRFLFLHREALRHTMMEHVLPAPFANCIAALSLRWALPNNFPWYFYWLLYQNRFSATESVTPRIQLGDPYLEMAKVW